MTEAEDTLRKIIETIEHAQATDDSSDAAAERDLAAYDRIVEILRGDGHLGSSPLEPRGDEH